MEGTEAEAGEEARRRDDISDPKMHISLNKGGAYV